MKGTRIILLVAEDASPDSLSLCQAASRLEGGSEICVILLAGKGADFFFQAAADRVWAFELPELPADDSAIARPLADFTRQLLPETLLFNATIRGRAIAAALAAELGTGLTADCCALSLEDGLLVQLRPAYGSQLNAEIVCEKARPQMASVRPGILPSAVLDENRQGRVEYITFKEPCRVKREQFSPFTGTGSLRSAEIVFAAGRGIGSREGFEKLKEIAAGTGAAIAASRGAVDLGFAPYSCQVGQTGVVVRPELYVACGISGSVQHLAGMSCAGKVVAVNSDPKAPIFRYADLGIVGDWQEVMEKFLAEYKFLQTEAKKS